MSWAMTDGEIASMWRTCKDRNEQVNILADLNVRSRAEVLGKLRELGCDLRGVRMHKTGGGAPRKPPIDELRAMQLYEEGLVDLDIAEALGESKHRVADWRKRMELRPNRAKKTKAAPAEVPEQKEENAMDNETVAFAVGTIPGSISANDAMGHAPTLRPQREEMSAKVLLAVLQRVCEVANGDAVTVRIGASAQKINGAAVSVAYDPDGNTEGVEVQLLVK